MDINTQFPDESSPDLDLGHSGWGVDLFREIERAPGEKPERLRLAAWGAGVTGMRWLDKLVDEGKVRVEYRGGYPDCYYVAAGVVLPILTAGLPAEKRLHPVGKFTFTPEGLDHRIELDLEKIAACPGNAELVIEMWDMS